MREWMDAVLLGSETALQEALRTMTNADREHMFESLCKMLGTTDDDLQIGVLRILIERARPLALSSEIWKRPLDATASIRDASSKHLTNLGIEVTDDRLRAMQNLYSRFVAERKKVPVSEAQLQRDGYFCQHCGLRFYNEELEHIPLLSPYKTRFKLKEDQLKPHWSGLDWRKPTIDHIWPVSLYGDNAYSNTVVLCKACNDGKKNYLCMHQSRPFVGLPTRAELKQGERLTTETFFAQIQRQPICQETGRTAKEVELTVRLKVPSIPPVLDNLITISSPEL